MNRIGKFFDALAFLRKKSFGSVEQLLHLRKVTRYNIGRK